MCERICGKFASLHTQKICKIGKEGKIHEAVHTKGSVVSSAQELQRIAETAKTGMPRAIDNLAQISIRFRVCNVSVDSHSKRLFYVFRYSSHTCIGMYANIVGTLVAGIKIGF